MSLFSLILIAIAVSLDGFWGGFAFGLRKIKIMPLSLLIIASWSIICSMAAMILGNSIKNFISPGWAKYIGAALLLLLGIYTLKEGCKQRKELKVKKKCSTRFDFSFGNLVNILSNPILADVDKENDIKPMEGTLLGLAVAMDASIAAFTLALMGFNPYTTPFLFGLTHFVLIGMGNTVAANTIINRFAERFSLLPGIILVTLALLRLV